MRITARSLSKNKKAHVKRQRTAVKCESFKELSYIGEGILYFSFWINEEKTEFCVFLRDPSSPAWVVSECDEYLMGSGVVGKLLRQS